MPHEPTPPTQAKWWDWSPHLLKYVDDTVIIDRVCFENATRFEDEDLAAREKHAIQTQNVFQRVTGKAEWKGMKVNTGKTKMLCVSDALSFLPGSYISAEGEKITSWGRNNMVKLLGFHLSNHTGVSAHMEALR